MIDEIKQNKDSYTNYEEIVSNWRLQRKVMLIDKGWVEVLNILKEKFQVYGLTKMDTGKFGNIPSIEEWRYEELKELNIEFSNNEELASYILEGNDNPVFYKGIFLTGSHSKGDILLKFSKVLNAKSIILVDDREEHLTNVQAYCNKSSIIFTGILFDGLKNLQDTPDPKLADFQKQHLLANATWLEDEVACKLMAESNE